jgi:hypothetical protein
MKLISRRWPRRLCLGVLAYFVIIAWPAETPAGVIPNLRINKAAVPMIAPPPSKVIVAATNQTVSVKAPSSSVLMVRRGNVFTNAVASRTEGDTKTYLLRPGDVYVAQGPPTGARPLSTTRQSLPDAVRTTLNGQEVAGHIEVAVQSEELVFNSSTRLFEGVLNICFASSNHAAFAQSPPLDVRLQTSAGLFVGVTNFSLATTGKDVCHDVPVHCSLNRTGAYVTVISPLLGRQKFTVDFEEPTWFERYKNFLVILGGVVLGALGGLVRAWQPPPSENIWRQVGTGAFCGLVLMLLGQVGAQKIFQIEGPVTTSVFLGLCAVFGYLGVRLLERFAPEGPK